MADATDDESVRAQLDANLVAQDDLRSALRSLQAEELDLRRRLEAIQRVATAITPSNQQASWNAAFEWDEQAQTTLKQRFGHDRWRPHQREVINATLSGRDVFAVLQTGSGKSLIYQLPGLLQPVGLTVVVSPLVSLMIDQVANLQAMGVPAALLAVDVTDRQASAAIHQQIADPSASGLRFLYVTPERIAKSKMLLSRLQKAYEAGALLRFAIDEAHCAAAQGHDFRPDYLSLGTLRSSFPRVPILCLTATASEAVRCDVERTLQMDGAGVVRFRGHFDRANICFEVRQKPDDTAELVDQMADVALRTHGGSAGIVYTLSRADAERVAAGLGERGVRCAAYHAGIDGEQRQLIQGAWQAGELQVVVATIAFGLGIDKPDVRFVLHHTCSKSLESYYQESGRAGRDGRPADAVVWWAPSDYYRLASLACESSDRHAALGALRAAGCYCEDGSKCRRQQLAELFGQHLAPREGAEARSRCCDVCAAQVSATSSISATASSYDEAGAQGSLPMRDVSALAAEALRQLLALNRQSASSDGGPAPAKLTALKLVEKLGGTLRVSSDDQGTGAEKRLSRRSLEHLVLRLVLSQAIDIHFSFTAYNILTYLYVRPHLVRVLEREDATPQGLRLSELARTLPAQLLLAAGPRARKAATAAGTGGGSSGGKRKAAHERESASKRVGSRKQTVARPPSAASDDDDFDFGPYEGNVDASHANTSGAARAPEAVIVLDDDDDDE